MTRPTIRHTVATSITSAEHQHDRMTITLPAPTFPLHLSPARPETAPHTPLREHTRHKRKEARHRNPLTGRASPAVIGQSRGHRTPIDRGGIAAPLPAHGPVANINQRKPP